MLLLSVEGACLAFGHAGLLDHARLQIDPGERVALDSPRSTTAQSGDNRGFPPPMYHKK
jgi:hypothetical protein